MSTELVKTELAPSIERLLVGGDLGQLKPEDRVSYYKMVCASVGLNPLTKPLEYITLNGKLTLYARKDCTDQLRNIHSVSITITSREIADDCYVVTARATMPSGRTDESIGAVSIGGLKGDAKANAFMKCETKAKRRATLSICGLGILDESELETIPQRSIKPADVPVTTEPVTFTKRPGEAALKPLPWKPESAASAIKQGAGVNEGPSASAAVPLPEVPNDCIDSGQAANLAKEFRKALPEKMQKDADDLLHEFLRVQGIKDVMGKPSKLAIKKESFLDVRQAACEYAGTFHV